MKNAQCEGRLVTLEAARREFSDSLSEILSTSMLPSVMGGELGRRERLGFL